MVAGVRFNRTRLALKRRIIGRLEGVERGRFNRTRLALKHVNKLAIQQFLL